MEFMKEQIMADKYRVAVLTASDKCATGDRIDKSGQIICKIMEQSGYVIVENDILPDEKLMLSQKMAEWCDSNIVDLIITTGGTGLSKRDCMPEATLAIAQKVIPGIAEAIRAYSMKITRRAMLSRAVSVIRENTLIINLPGSPKAVSESLDCILPYLMHGLDIMTGRKGECASEGE